MKSTKYLWGVALIALIFAIGSYFHIGQALGAAGDIVTNIVTYTKGIKMGDQTSTWYSKTVQPGTNQILLYTNTSNRDVYADYGEVDVLTGQTASSTFKLSLVATSSTSISSVLDFSTVANDSRALIASSLVATSSTATSTSSVYAAAKSFGAGSVIIPSGSSLIGYIQQNTAAVTGCNGAVGLCEAATSTKRGVDPVFKARIHY